VGATNVLPRGPLPQPQRASATLHFNNDPFPILRSLGVAPRRTTRSPRSHLGLLTITHESCSPMLGDDGVGEPIAPAGDATTVNLASLARDRSARCPGPGARRRGLDGGLSGGPASSAAAGLEIRGQLDRV